MYESDRQGMLFDVNHSVGYFKFKSPFETWIRVNGYFFVTVAKILIKSNCMEWLKNNDNFGSCAIIEQFFFRRSSNIANGSCKFIVCINTNSFGRVFFILVFVFKFKCMRSARDGQTEFNELIWILYCIVRHFIILTVPSDWANKKSSNRREKTVKIKHFVGFFLIVRPQNIWPKTQMKKPENNLK